MKPVIDMTTPQLVRAFGAIKIAQGRGQALGLASPLSIERHERLGEIVLELMHRGVLD